MANHRREFDEEVFRSAVEKSTSWGELHRLLGVTISGSSYKMLQRNCEERGLDVSHFWSKTGDGLDHPAYVPASEFLNDFRSIDTKRLKAKLLLEGLLEERCKACGTGNEWNGLPLVLQLHHVDGDPKNNRLENLEILCPNCHTQTDTWGSKARVESDMVA